MTDSQIEFNEASGEISLNDSQLTLEWLAVLSAQNFSYSLSQEGDTWIIQLDPDTYQAACIEIQRYEKERTFFDILKQRREGIIRFHFQRSDLSIVVGLLLLFFYVYSGSTEDQSLWHTTGRLESAAVLKGEWWRTVTALTLHADIPHALGNMFFLIIFSAAACYTFGAGSAWLFILLSGILGNALTVYTYQTFKPWANHCAVGASTAVFGALGILGAFRFCEKMLDSRLHITSLVPMLCAIALLFLTGAAQGSDIIAHLMGFLTGSLLGVIAFFCRLRKLKQNYVFQFLPFAVAVFIIYYGWSLARA